MINLLYKLKNPAVVLLLASILLIWPIFIGHFILGGTDVLFNHFPNLLFGIEHWQEYGKFPLWNPYIFAGRDATGSMASHYLNPIFWPLLILSREYILHGLAFGYFFAAYITALSWYKISRIYKLKNTTAILVSLTSIYGTFFWFATTTMIAIPMFMFSTLAALIILRNKFENNILLSVVLLSFCLAGILLFPHPGYITGFYTLVLGATISKFVRLQFNFQSSSKVFFIIFLAFILAILLSAYRIFPVILELINHGGSVMKHPVLKNEGGFGYYILPLINLYSVGTTIGENFFVLDSLNIRGGRHAQFHTSLYYGILPLLIICTKFSRKFDWWTLLLSFVFFTCVSKNVSIFAPLNNLVAIIMYPVDHDAIYRIGSHFSFLALLINCLKPIATEPLINVKRYKIILMSVVFIFFILQTNIWYALYHKFHSELINLSTLQNVLFYKVSLLIISAVFLFNLFHLSKIETNKNLKLYMLANIILGLLITIIIFALSRFINLSGGGDENRILFGLSELFALFIVVILYLRSLTTSPFDAPQKQKIVTLIWLFIAIILVTYRPSGTSEMNPLGVLTTGIFGFIRFLMFIAIFSHLLINSKTEFARSLDDKRFLIPIFLLIFLDLLGANRIYSYVNTDKPYVRNIDTLYPTNNFLINSQEDIIETQNSLKDNTFSSMDNKNSVWKKGGDPSEYHNLTSCNSTKHAESSILCFNSSEDADITLFQDVSIPRNTPMVSLGGWVYLDKGEEIRIFLTSPSERSAGKIFTLDQTKKWVWFNISIPLSRWNVLRGGLVVRPHIQFMGGNKLQLRELKLVIGPRVIPETIPEGANLPDRVEFNGHDYRANRITQFVSISDWHELMANYSSVYKVRAYSGVDSDMQSTWIDFLGNFKELSPSWFHRAGLLPVIDNDRFLDLLGVKYDVKNGSIIERGNPMTRFMSFNKMLKSDSVTSSLKILKSENFDPLLEVIVNEDIDYKLDASKQTGFLKYKTYNYDYLEIDIKQNFGRIIFFGDTYSKSWIALWNGKEIPIFRVNSVFMGVNLPDGEGKLTFSFKPYLFTQLTYLALFIFSLMVLSTLVFFFLRWQKKVVASHK